MRKARGNQLYYLTVSDKGITRVNRADVDNAKEAVKNHTAKFQLHAVYASDIESARQKVAQHKTEIYNLSGLTRTCGAYFPTTDTKGRKIHRCLFYEPACNTKKCKADPNALSGLSEIKTPYQEDFPFIQFKKINGKFKAFYSGTNDLYEIDNIPIDIEFNSPREGYRIMLYKIKPEIESLKHKIIPEQSSFIEPSQIALFGISGFTATCRTFKRNAQGKKYCAEYAPTCGAGDQGCRTEPAPIPGKDRRTKKDYEIEAKAIAQMLADDANQDLERNKGLLRQVLSYGGIAPHKGGFLREEYNELPSKYKRKEGVPLDELAQELGTNESDLTSKIFEAEAQFRMLKEMRGSTTKRFKSDDFIDEAWNRMQSGRGFMGSLAYLRPGADKEERQKQKEILKNLYSDYYAPRHDVFVDRYNKAEEAQKQKDYMANRGITKGQMTLFGGRISKKIHPEEYFTTKQIEMFPGLKRELIMESEDIATSDDPFEACLERKGWDLKRVKKLQDSISVKLTPGLFSKQTDKLSRSETELQDTMQDCLDTMGKKGVLFGRFERKRLQHQKDLKVIPKNFIPYQFEDGSTIFVNPEGIEAWTDVYTDKGMKERKRIFYASYLPSGKFILWHTQESLKRRIKGDPGQMTLFGGLANATKATWKNREITPELLAKAKAQYKIHGWSMVHDVYKEGHAPKEVKGVYRESGDEIIGYAYSPEYFIKSNVTNMPVRYYIELENGAIVHPDELYRIKVDKSGKVSLPASESISVKVEGGRLTTYHSFERAFPLYKTDKNITLTNKDSGISITLPSDDWWKLRNKLSMAFRGHDKTFSEALDVISSYYPEAISISNQTMEERILYPKNKLAKSKTEELVKGKHSKMTLFGLFDKEPWQMTKDEFISHSLARDVAYQNALKNSDKSNLQIEKDRALWSIDRKHQTSIITALMNHKQVPKKVLDEYPDFYSPSHSQTKIPPWQKAEKIITEKAGQMTLFGVPFVESGRFTPDLTKNQIRVRVLNPKYFRSYFIRRSTTPGVQYAMGKHEKGNVVTQSIRFSKKLFNISSAKTWFSENIGRIIKRDMKQAAT